MKKLIMIIAMLTLVSCGKKKECKDLQVDAFGATICAQQTLDSKISDALDAYLADNQLSCTVDYTTQPEDGALITCPDGTAAFVSNGTDGVDGLDGVNGTDGLDGLIVAYIDPCGPETTHDELLYIDRDGNFHTWFKDVGHVILNEGTTYQTTDGTSCKFKIISGTLVEL